MPHANPAAQQPGSARRLRLLGNDTAARGLGVAAGIAAGGGTGLVTLDGSRSEVRAALGAIAAAGSHIGLRIPPGCPLGPGEVRAALGTVPPVVVLDRDVAHAWQDLGTLAGVTVLVEVNDVDQARRAVDAGAAGVIGVGRESGGATASIGAFVLLGQLLAAPLGVGVWLRGGIGERTAAAAVRSGAAGVVLDSQWGLFDTSALPAAARARLRRLDGSEPAVDPDTGRVGVDGLPFGSDAVLARVLTAHHRGVPDAARAILAAIDDALAPGAAEKSREHGSAAMTAVIGTALPLAQGPMTRVSDTPAFARAVAGEDGLPFVALAMASAATADELLDGTAEALGDRPWGVGVLGFAADDTRTAHLEAIRRVRPRCALIAGGRPSQAAALESEGVATFLHAPSPTLLEQFLDAGARRFVFEGSECGGHIGPSTSFVLWERQIAVLLDALEAGRVRGADVQVFFAGGIHDARSATVVWAASAPLAAHGVGVGLLMGTAYLFTTEAIATEAIGLEFAAQAASAAGTAVIETSPGHAIRCVPGPFVEEFEATRARLEVDGVPAGERAERLEDMVTGRLRIASKGVVRDGDRLVSVDAAVQRREGLFMVGEVCALRTERLSVAELHQQVGGAVLALDECAVPGSALPAPGLPRLGDVAIVGMACAFPQAPDLDAFAQLLWTGTDAVGDVPTDRWDVDRHYRDGEADASAGLSASRWGGFLDRIAFDPLAYGIPPSSLGSIDPAQLLTLEMAARALRDAGYDALGTGAGRAFDRERTAVVVGAEAGGDLADAVTVRAVLPTYASGVPAGLDAALPPLTDDSFPGTLANVIAGRVANRLDLGGTNLTVDAACGSGLAAVDVACKELALGTADTVLCGAVDLHNGIHDYLMFTAAGALSPTGRCRPFDAAADGIALGEGVATVVLKRLDDARRDGDRVYAVIAGVGAASDGRSLGLTAPRPEGQRRAIDRAYAAAGADPAATELVEAHGTGTVVGDRTELGVLTDVFAAAGAPAAGCTLGSVKSQIGHTKCAAGLAGLIKTSLALWHGVLPSTLHVTRPTATWNDDTSPFVLRDASRPWATPTTDRQAGVSAFGFGGINLHVVLRGADTAPPHPLLARWPAEVVLVRGADPTDRARTLLARLESDSADLAAFAATAAEEADAAGGPTTAAVVATGLDDLRDALRAVVAGSAHPGVVRPDPATTGRPVAFVFSGQGSQRPGMASELLGALPRLRWLLSLDPALADTMLPATAHDEQARADGADALRDTRAAQPALGLHEAALVDVLAEVGVRPEAVAGHSYGELVAFHAAGAFDAATLLDLSSRRAFAVLDAVAASGGDPGTMAAVRRPAVEVRAALAAEGLDTVIVANDNAPGQTVVAGPTEDVAVAVARLRERSLSTTSVPVACAFHSPLVAGAGAAFADAVRDADVVAPSLPVWSNRTAARHGELDAAGVAAELGRQIESPVRFSEMVTDLLDTTGAGTVVEIGPGRVLARLVGEIAEARGEGAAPVDVLAIDPAPGDALRSLLVLLARLAVAGRDVRLAPLYRARPRLEREGGRWCVDGRLVRGLDGEPVASGLGPATADRRVPMPSAPAAPTPARVVADTVAASAGREQVVVEFLRSSRELLAAQREVVLTYLGAAPAAPAAAGVAALPALEATPVTSVPRPAGEPAASPAPIEAAPEVAWTRERVRAAVVDAVVERTGYPAEMLADDLDLEADLSVDSLKRTEIGGALVTALDLRDRVDDQAMDGLARARTTAAVTDWLCDHLGLDAGETPVSEAPGPEPAPAVVERLVLAPAPLPELDGDGPARLAGRRARLLVGDEQQSLATATANALRAAGAEVVDAFEDHRPEELVCDLRALELADPSEREPALVAFTGVRDAARTDAAEHLICAATDDAGAPAAHGLRGLVRTAAAELDLPVVRLLETDQTDAADLARLVVDALARPGAPALLRDVDGDRSTLTATAQPLPEVADPDDGVAAAGLGQDAVVVLFGGARGVTAHLATALARHGHCRLELAGRSAPPGDEDPELADLTDAAALRGALARRGGRSPRDIEREVTGLLAAREVRRTFTELTALGASVTHHVCDVREGEAVARLIKDVQARHGRIDLVVHAAGTLEDARLVEKDDASFERVFDTKVGGARHLLDALDDAGIVPGAVVFYGSVAGALGNPGQVDYAAANDALETVGAAWARRRGARVLTAHWGPWAPDAAHPGMVGPELARLYQRRGEPLLDPRAAVAALLSELAHGERETTAVVLRGRA